MTKTCCIFLSFCWAFFLAGNAHALVNPSLQPGDLFERHTLVVVFRIVNIDDAKKTVTLTAEKVLKGEFAPKQVTLTAVGDEMLTAFNSVLHKGSALTAFVGKPRKPLSFDFYCGGEGRWQGGEIASAEDLSQWNWTRDYNAHELFGTFNGHTDQLAEMMEDQAAGRGFFPAQVFDQFKADQLIGKFDQPVHGVALYDFDGDGLLDIYACSAVGDRFYAQSTPLVFTDRTKEMGLAGNASTSVNAADCDGDGRADLLLDGVIWKQGENKGFTKSDLLPASANAKVLSSAFADVNGDGYPDVLVSHQAGGLTYYANPGAKSGPFADLTKASGLDKPECGAGGTAWLMVGDWKGDGRLALFYSSGGGFLLVQNQAGEFAPSGDEMGYDFNAGGAPSGLTGAGCFASVWKNGRQDLLFPRDTGMALLVKTDGEVLDGATHGNELQLTATDQLPLIAEDLNADGNVDIYVGSRSGKSNIHYLNRGYGSFMSPTRYKPTIFSGTAHGLGAWGLAAGDVNGDGANDLLIGAPNGNLTLIVNDTLSLRAPTEHPISQQKKLEQTCIVSVHVTGKIGVLGATVTLADAKGRIVGRRDIGSNIATGNRSPDTVNLAVREPGAYTLKVRYSDGTTRTWPVEVGKEKRTAITASATDKP